MQNIPSPRENLEGQGKYQSQCTISRKLTLWNWLKATGARLPRKKRAHNQAIYEDVVSSAKFLI